MSLGTTTPDGPASPGVTSVDGQQELVTAKVVERMLSRWANKAVIADACDRSLYSEFAGRSGPPVGDQITIPIRDRHRITVGKTYQGQPRQANFTTLSVGPVEGIDDAVNMWTEGMYRSERIEKQRSDDKMSRLIAGVERKLAQAMSGSTGYNRFTQPYQQSPDRPAAAQSKTLSAAGEGEKAASHPGLKLLTEARNDLVSRAINADEYCALLDTDTVEGIGLGAVNAPYTNPLGRDVYGQGNIAGMSRANWLIKESALNGTFTFPAAQAITVATAPAEGATTVRLNIPAGTGLKAGTPLEFHEVLGVNEETSDPVTKRAGFVVTEDTPTTGTAKNVNVFPAFRASTAGDAVRRRTCSALPSATAKVYIGGLDTGNGIDRTAYGAKTVSQSFLIARDTTMLVFVDPALPTNDVEDAMIRNKQYRIAFSTIVYFDGNETEHKARIQMRTGQKTTEPEAGRRVGGNESAA